LTQNSETSGKNNNNIIKFKNNTNENNSPKSKGRNNLPTNQNYENLAYKTTINSNSSNKFKRKTSKENSNNLITNDNQKNQNLLNLKQDLTPRDSSNPKIFNHENEKIVNLNTTRKTRFSVPKANKKVGFVKNRSKSEYNIAMPNNILKITEEAKGEKNNSDLNYNISGNNLNKNDLRNLEKIIEINNSNSNINLNLNNSNSNKSETTKEVNNNLNTIKNTQLNCENLQNPNSVFLTNNRNKDNLNNQFSKHQRINSIRGSLAKTNTIKNSKILTNSRINTSNTERKEERKKKKISLISADSLKNDFMRFENENKRKSVLNSKRNSKIENFDNHKAQRYSAVSSSNSRSRGHYNNLKNNINFYSNEEKNHENTGNAQNPRDLYYDDLYINNRNEKIQKEIKYDYHNDLNNNINFKQSKPLGFASYDNNYYDKLNFNYKNEYDAEIHEKMNDYFLNRNFKSESNNTQKIIQEKANIDNNFYENNNPSIKESSKDINKLSSNFETFQTKFYNNADLNNNLNYQEDKNFEDVKYNKYNEDNININNNLSYKNREINAAIADKFRDLSPIRESEYSYDVYKKRDSKLESISNQLDVYNDINNNENNRFERFRNNHANINNNNIYPNNNENFTNNNYRANRREIDSNPRFDEAINNFNNLYEFKNNKNSNFIYDEVHEKILPLKNFEGESYPENLYKEDIKYIRENEMLYNSNKIKNDTKFEEIDSNRKLNYKSNEFNQTGSTFKKFTNSNFSNSKVKKKKKNDSSFVPWDKVYKEKFKEQFKNDIKLNNVPTNKKKYIK